MTPSFGTVLYDPYYQYDDTPDGPTGQKRIVFLNDGTCGFYLVVKVTSQNTPEFKGRVPGCQRLNKYPNFFVPVGTCDGFSKDTWIGLDKYKEYPIKRTHARLASKILEYKGTMETQMFVNLLDCVMAAKYVERDYREMLMKHRVTIGLALSEAGKKMPPKK